jgi:hypothetical protein
MMASWVTQPISVNAVWKTQELSPDSSVEEDVDTLQEAEGLTHVVTSNS